MRKSKQNKEMPYFKLKIGSKNMRLWSPLCDLSTNVDKFKPDLSTFADKSRKKLQK